MTLHLIETGLVDQRAKIDITIDAVTHGHLVNTLGQFFTEGVGHLFMHEDAVGTDAGLATTAELVGDQVIGGGIQVGVVEDDERCVTAQFQRQFLNLLGGVDDQFPADFGGTGKAQHRHVRAFAQHLADHAGLAHHQVDHAIRHVGVLVHQGEQGNHGQRSLTGRLDHRRAAGRQRG